MSDIDYCLSMVISHTFCKHAGFTARTVRLTKEAGTVTKLINCRSSSGNSEAENFLDCLLPGLLPINSRNQVAGLVCSTLLTAFS